MAATAKKHAPTPPTMGLRRYALEAELDPFCPPDWRWRRLEAKASPADGAGPKKMTRLDEAWLKEARPLFLAYRSGAKKRDALAAQNPGLLTALHLHYHKPDHPIEANILEARLLSGAPLEEIATALKTPLAAVRWYAKLFFDVQPHLNAKDWIFTQAILPTIRAVYGSGDEGVKVVAQGRADPSLKLFAYLGGPHLFDHMLFGFPVGLKARHAADVPDVMDAFFKIGVRVKSLLAVSAMPVSVYNAVEVLNVHLNLLALQKDDDGKTKERFLAEAVDTVLHGAQWEVTTRQPRRDDEPPPTYLPRSGEVDGRLTAPDPEELNLRDRLAQQRREQQAAVVHSANS